LRNESPAFAIEMCSDKFSLEHALRNIDFFSLLFCDYDF